MYASGNSLALKALLPIRSNFLLFDLALFSNLIPQVFADVDAYVS
jgi:hypothetical protein